MAVCAVEVAAVIEGKAEWVDLPVGPDFDARAIGFEAEYVARVKLDLRAIFGLQLAGVIEAVGGVDPAVAPHTEARAHAVRVFFIA